MKYEKTRISEDVFVYTCVLYMFNVSVLKTYTCLMFRF